MKAEDKAEVRGMLAEFARELHKRWDNVWQNDLPLSNAFAGVVELYEQPEPAPSVEPKSPGSGTGHNITDGPELVANTSPVPSEYAGPEWGYGDTVQSTNGRSYQVIATRGSSVFAENDESTILFGHASLKRTALAPIEEGDDVSVNIPSYQGTAKVRLSDGDRFQVIWAVAQFGVPNDVAVAWCHRHELTLIRPPEDKACD